jgi:alkylation response protein AidB-like acyl-CoA dehydrogenase
LGASIKFSIENKAASGAVLGKPLQMVGNCYLIRHSQGVMVWDTGVSDDVAIPGTRAVMVGHVNSEGLTEPEVPASLSPSALRYLRARIGFRSWRAVHWLAYASWPVALVHALGTGSDARTLHATAARDPSTGEYVLNGEKWFVTGPDDTDFMIFHCLVVDGDDRRPTLFLVDYDTAGVVVKHDPDYTHTFADRHPQFVLTDVRVPATAVLGGVGRADELTNEWFVEERIHIGARCSGAMERLLDLALEWATGRIQFGQRIYDFQGVSFPLADSAADASAARLLTRECAWLADTGADPKMVHAKASLAKLFASEAAWRCADRVVQVFGGRGYMREFAPERFLRELRVDRIWEGTSEIQRLIIARALEKRGVNRVVG